MDPISWLCLPTRNGTFKTTKRGDLNNRRMEFALKTEVFSNAASQSNKCFRTTRYTDTSLQKTRHQQNKKITDKGLSENMVPPNPVLHIKWMNLTTLGVHSAMRPIFRCGELATRPRFVFRRFATRWPKLGKLLGHHQPWVKQAEMRKSSISSKQTLGVRRLPTQKCGCWLIYSHENLYSFMYNISIINIYIYTYI